MRSKPRKLDADGLWNYALRVLGGRAHSANELKQKLSRRAESPEALSMTVAKLGEYGLTDDRKFSETLASARLQSQGFGRFRVMNELRTKRVAQPIAEAAIEKAYSGTEEADLIGNFLDRKYRGKNLRVFLSEKKNLASAYRRLRVAGFSSTGSLSVLKRYSAQVDEIDPPENEELS